MTTETKTKPKTTRKPIKTGPKPAEPGTVAGDVDEAIETLSPRVAERKQRVYYGDEDSGVEFERIYTQRKLSWFSQIEFTALLGKAIDNVFDKNSESSGSIGELLTEGSTSIEGFLRIVMQVAATAPELLTELYMVALAIPRHERPMVEDIWMLPHDEETGAGGLSEDDGFEILTTIFSQNGESIRRLFLERLPKLVEIATEALADQSKAKSESPEQD